ncbi:MAG: MSMEG_4193 family putative phosphomutase [Chloroflexi bacterium]|jgi:probable phosphomutase (TIGR03848 family)|nr:MAG: MSMEG_4193 family putative phosphomutase [Chloroflexota bacterium]
MSTLVLIRHASTAETGRSLSGRLPGIPLSEKGREEARILAERLSGVAFTRIASSPIQRCLETLEPILRTRTTGVAARPEVEIDERLIEVDYGAWSGRELKTLAKDPLWTTVQRQPSAMHFPKGEALAAAAARGVAAVRERSAALGGDDVWLAASHGDVIKAIVADALGTPLDLFQRISIDPASITVIRYGGERPTVVRVNDSGTPLSTLLSGRRHGSLLDRIRGRSGGAR